MKLILTSRLYNTIPITKRELSVSHGDRSLIYHLNYSSLILLHKYTMYKTRNVSKAALLKNDFNESSEIYAWAAIFFFFFFFEKSKKTYKLRKFGLIFSEKQVIDQMFSTHVLKVLSRMNYF